MNTRRPLLRTFAGLLSRVWLTAGRGRMAAAGSLRILNFHETPRDAHPVFVQLANRLRDEHGLVSPQDAAALLEKMEGVPDVQDRAPCLLTFDDGFRSNYFLAREVLEPLGIRALFFVCPGLVDLEPGLQRKAIAENIRLDLPTAGNAGLEQELMTWEDIQALASAGHEIGSHSWSHRRLSALGQDEMEAEIGNAASLLESRLGRPARWFAFPFGDIASVNSATLACAAEHHRFCRSGVRGLNAPGAPALGLLSQTIDLGAPHDYQLATAAGALDFRYRAARKELSAELPS